MNRLILLLALIAILSIPAYAAVIVVGPSTSPYFCPACPNCSYYGMPCPVPYYDSNSMFSYDQNYRYGAYDSSGGNFTISPYSQFPPYLGIDASSQWFASPSR